MPVSWSIRLTYEAYEEMKGLYGAIGQTADEAIAKLDGKAKAALPRLLHDLSAVLRDQSSAEIGGRELTIRQLPFDEVIRDDDSKRLVDALIAARIIVSSATGDDPKSRRALIGLAHQRVLVSWELARKVTKDSDDFFCLRDDVEVQRQRWLSGGRRETC